MFDFIISFRKLGLFQCFADQVLVKKGYFISINVLRNKILKSSIFTETFDVDDYHDHWLFINRFNLKLVVLCLKHCLSFNRLFSTPCTNINLECTLLENETTLPQWSIFTQKRQKPSIFQRQASLL